VDSAAAGVEAPVLALVPVRDAPAPVQAAVGKKIKPILPGQQITRQDISQEYSELTF
jgi:hypothetical protein